MAGIKVRNKIGETNDCYPSFYLSPYDFPEFRNYKITRFQLLKRSMSVALNIYNHWALLFELEEKVLFVAEYGSSGVCLGLFKANNWYSAYSSIMGDDEYVYYMDFPIDHIRDYNFFYLIEKIKHIVEDKQYYRSNYSVISKSCQDFCKDLADVILPDTKSYHLVSEAFKTVSSLLSPPELFLNVLFVASKYKDKSLCRGDINLKQNFDGFSLHVVQFLQQNDAEVTNSIPNHKISDLFKNAIDRLKCSRSGSYEYSYILEILEFLVDKINNSNIYDCKNYIHYLYDSLNSNEEHFMVFIRKFSEKISNFNKLSECECLLIKSSKKNDVVLFKFLIEIGVDLKKIFNQYWTRLLKPLTIVVILKRKIN